MHTRSESTSFAKRVGVLLFDSAVYAGFLATFVSVILFVEGLLLPKTIDTGLDSAFGTALLVNASILGLFGVQHTIMARQRFKR